MAAENEKERAPAPAARWTVCGGRSEAVLDSRARAACFCVAVISSAVGDPFTRTCVAFAHGTLWAVRPARRKFPQDDVGF